MASDIIARVTNTFAMAAASCVISTTSGATDNALELLVGHWDVQVVTINPSRSEVTYTETYEWVLDKQFLRGQTDQKSDGTAEIVFATYDSEVDGYPFWVFSSSGTYTYLAPASWNSRTRTMEWKNPPNSDISYHTVLVFPGDGLREWTLIVKDWKGSVLLQQQGKAVRRGD